MPIQNNKNLAFSLVELSIVLVILGLLVGGILSGRALIRSAELRAITTEKDRYVSAVYAFRDKYFYMPGDLPNAYQFWGATCGTNDTTASTGCNGDGDGEITTLNEERFKVWEHLSRAGLIEGSFDGVTNAPDYYSSSNVPKSRFPSAYWELSSDHGNVSDPTATLSISQHIYLRIGGISSGTSSIVPDTISLSHEEAWITDTKVDDGKANLGKLRGDGALTCVDDGYGLDPTDYYTLKNGHASDADCMLHFILQ
jgi:prepilin-type N-terminal cleavage/methylation domain-containing protein